MDEDVFDQMFEALYQSDTHMNNPHKPTHDGNPTEHTTKNPLTQTTSANTTNKN